MPKSYKTHKTTKIVQKDSNSWNDLTWRKMARLEESEGYTAQAQEVARLAMRAVRMMVRDSSIRDWLEWEWMDGLYVAREGIGSRLGFVKEDWLGLTLGSLRLAMVTKWELMKTLSVMDEERYRRRAMMVRLTQRDVKKSTNEPRLHDEWKQLTWNDERRQRGTKTTSNGRLAWNNWRWAEGEHDGDWLGFQGRRRWIVVIIGAYPEVL